MATEANIASAAKNAVVVETNAVFLSIFIGLSRIELSGTTQDENSDLRRTVWFAWDMRRIAHDFNDKAAKATFFQQYMRCQVESLVWCEQNAPSLEYSINCIEQNFGEVAERLTKSPGAILDVGAMRQRP